MKSYLLSLGFGSTFSSLFPESHIADSKAKSVALKHVKSCEADLGGTDLLAPLQAIYNMSLGHRSRQIFVFTDGEVDNDKQCVRLVQQHSSKRMQLLIGLQIPLDVSLLELVQM